MSARPFPLTLRALARLLSYPDAELRAHLGELRDALRDEHALSAGRLMEVDALIDELRAADSLGAEAAYVELFDRGRATALHLFEHVHGDARSRGPAMVDLLQTYEQAGLQLAGGELPDYLPAVVEYASTQPAEQAASLLREIADLVRKIYSALLDRKSGYAALLAALLDLAGENTQPVKLAAEPAIDESWAEPEAFGGCSSAGQARPGQPQAVRVVRPNPTPSASTAMQHPGAPR